MRKNRYIPFSYKMMIPYLILILLTDAIVGFFSYRIAFESRTELIKTNVTWTMEQTRDNVLYKMRDLQVVADSLFSSPSLQGYLGVVGDRKHIYEVTSQYLIPMLETSMRMSAQNIRVILYAKNPLLNEIYSDMSGPIHDKNYAILSFSRIQDTAWFNQLSDNNQDNLWIQVDTDRSQHNISLVRKLISFNDYQSEIGYLRLSVPIEDLFLSLESLDLDEGMIVRIEDQQAETIIAQNVQQTYADPSQYLTIRQPVTDTNFIMTTMVPKSILMKDAGKIGGITVLVCTLSFLFAALIAVVIARYSGRKMIRIVSFVRTLQLGHFGKQIQFVGHDEFSQISAAFNQMSYHIEELMQEVYQQGIEKKEQELLALQAQINPHFLYNTLSSINSLANIGKVNQLSAMVSALTRFYRLTLNDGNIFILLRDEIEQVKAYLDIQSIKYAGRFTVSYEIDPDIEGCTTIKLILQPFVENIFKHAWFDEHIHIRITGRRADDHIEMKIIDNGVGILPDRLRNILNKKSETGGYGVFNVQERIQLQYGLQYGIDIHSRPGIGTGVRISLPIHVGNFKGVNGE